MKMTHGGPFLSNGDSSDSLEISNGMNMDACCPGGQSEALSSVIDVQAARALDHRLY